MSHTIDISSDLGREEFFKYPEFVETVDGTMKSDKRYSVVVNEEPKIQTADYLVAFSGKSQNYCVGTVDMVDSTRISATIGNAKIAKYYQIFLNSMSKVLGNFDAVVIKNIGDCLLYYFPDSNNSRYDFHKALKCSISMIDSHDMICEKLKEENLPKVDYRISMDYGTIIKMSTTDSSKTDMIGPSINMCTKINRYAHKNGIVFGGDMYEMVKKLNGYDVRHIADYSVGFRNSYPVYSLARQ